jgi:hypothetical protein
MKWLIRLCVLTVVVFTYSNAPAQSYYEEPLKVFSGGLILGMNFTQVDGDTYFGYHKVGLNAGGVVYVHFTKVFGASMELLYSQKGSRGESVLESSTAGTYVAKYFMNLNYVEVPVTLHIVSHKFDFEGGASYARLIKSKEWIQTDMPVIIDPDHNRYNTSDVELIFGLGREVYKHWFLNLRFQYSLTSVRPPERIPVGFGYGSIGQFNNLFSLRVIYWL